MGDDMQDVKDIREQTFELLEAVAKEEGLPAHRPSEGRLRIELNSYWTAEVSMGADDDRCTLAGIIDGEIDDETSTTTDGIVDAVKSRIAAAR